MFVQGSGVSLGGTLEVRQEADPVFDPVTGQLAVRLSCGQLSIPTNLPVAAEWTVSLTNNTAGSLAGLCYIIVLSLRIP